jgi:uncharacterized membrane protein
MVISWYMNVGGGTKFADLVYVLDYVRKGILSSLWETGMTAELLTRQELSILHLMTKLLQITTQFFIAIGVVQLVQGLETVKKTTITAAYAALSIVTFVFLVCLTVVPNLPEATFGLTRGYHILLLILAPLCIMGGEAFFGWIARAIQLLRNRMKRSFTVIKPLSPLKLLTLFLVVYLLFNTGFVYEVTQDPKTTASFDNSIESPSYSQSEDVSMVWVLRNKGMRRLYTDDMGYFLNLRYNQEAFAALFRLSEDGQVPLPEKYFYTFLRVREGKAIIYRPWHTEVEITHFEYIDIDSLSSSLDASRIFDDGKAQILIR